MNSKASNCLTRSKRVLGFMVLGLRGFGGFRVEGLAPEMVLGGMQGYAGIHSYIFLGH